MRLLPRIVEDADQATVFDNTGAAPRVFSFRGGAPLASQDVVPPYLLQRLYHPLRERKADASTLTTLYPSLSRCEEETTYVGRLVWQSKHFIVQQTASRPLRHDRLTLEGSAPNGALCAMRYKDAAGTIEDAP